MTDATDTADDADLRKRRREFESYASAKANEIDEQRVSWRYYYADQYSAEQLRELKKRGQPPIIFDRIGRKIDGLVGVVRKLRTDPKAFPRTENQQGGADVATQVIRTVMDASRFEDIEAEGARDGAVHGIGVSELQMVTGDQGDPDFKFAYVDPRSFFYDPRSVKPDFSDARYMGTYKWAGLDEIDEIVEGGSEKVRGASEGEIYTAFDADREILWVDEKERVRLVDHWYIKGGVWHWCLHVGSIELMSGESPFTADDGKTFCKFFAYANMIDADGDHTGYIRRLKGPQDAINQHRSKAIWIMNTRQIKIQRGAAEEMGGVENVRKQAARPDGVFEFNQDPNEVEVVQPAQEFLQQTQYFQDAKQEIETFGPNQALLGDLGSGASGRAYSMAQQAGLAELGPFLKNFRMWKLAQYEAAWYAAQKYWTGNRFIRVTDDQGLAQFLEVNGVQFHPETQQPMMVNALGSINVDILVDEGPDTENIMGDVFDTLQALAQNNVPVPPQVIIETSNLPSEVKKKLTGMLSQPDPQKEAAAKLELEGKQAENEKTKSEAVKNIAQAQAAGAPSPQKPAKQELPMELQIGQALAELRNTDADTQEKIARAGKTDIEASLAPQQAQHRAELDRANFIQSARDRADDRRERAAIS